MSPRIDARARELLDAPDPLFAVAHELAEWEARMDALVRRLDHVEAVLGDRGRP